MSKKNKKIEVCAYANRLAGACGVHHMCNFYDAIPGVSGWTNNIPVRSIEGGGAGWLTAGFINNSVNKKTYECLVKQHGTPVFQTPVRVNRNSSNRFFFAVWDTR